MGSISVIPLQHTIGRICFQCLYSYGWLPGRIARIFNRMHGLTLTTAEIKRLRRELNRAETCGENTAPDGEADAGK